MAVSTDRQQDSVRTPSWWERVRARAREGYQEDGVFRPVRLPIWTDLAISAAIIVVVLAMFAGFFVFLARTQSR